MILLATLLRRLADALDPPQAGVSVAEAQSEYLRAVLSHRGQRAAYAKLRTAMNHELRRELGR